MCLTGYSHRVKTSYRDTLLHTLRRCSVHTQPDHCGIAVKDAVFFSVTYTKLRVFWVMKTISAMLVRSHTVCQAATWSMHSVFDPLVVGF